MLAILRACTDLHATRREREREEERERNKENTSCVESCGRVKMTCVADALCCLGVYGALEAMPCQQAGAACLGPASGALLFLQSFSKCRRRTVLTRSQGGGGQRTHASFPLDDRLASLPPHQNPSARESRELICCVWNSGLRRLEEATYTRCRTHTQVRCSGLDWIFKH